MKLLRIGDLTHGTRDRVGEKAWNLDQLVKAGFVVPSAVVIPNDLLWEAAESSDADTAIRRHLHRGLNNSGMIRALLWDIDLGSIGDVLPVLGESLAVRSSSTLEDGPHSSLAGAFDSLLDVEPGAAVDAVRQVWSSGFSPLALALADDVPPDHLAVIVQQQVQPTVAGVCFTADPLSGSANQLIVECVQGSAEALLSGEGTPYRYALDRMGTCASDATDGPLSASDLERLRTEMLAVEQLFGVPVDVEFALVAGESRPVILQARPITGTPAFAAVRFGPVTAVPIDDLIAATALVRADSELLALVQRRIDKHNYVRAAARRHNIPVDEQWLLQATGSATAREMADAAAEVTRTEVLEIALPHSPLRRVRREALPAWSADQWRPGQTTFVADLQLGVTSGYAALQSDGHLVVEYIPGAAGGLMFGHGPFSTVITDDTGERVKEQRRPADAYWALDAATLQITRRSRPRTPPALEPTVLAEIRRITEALRQELGEVRIEWIRTDTGEIKLWDLSVETGRELPARISGTISPGQATGPAVVLLDVAPLQEILRDRSVIPDPEFLATHGSSAADEVRARLLGGQVRPIVVTPWPRTCLALLVGHVAGFVFDDAATLCHLSIILREAGVPAVVRPAATGEIAPGTQLRLIAGRYEEVR